MAGSEPYSKIPVELDHSLKGQRSFFEASSFFSDHEEAQETLPIKGPPDSKKQKIDVDAKAKEIRQILRYFMVNRSEKAIEAYMAIQELNPDQIEEFFKKYPNLAEKITGHLPGEFLNDPGFGLQRGIAEGEEQKLLVEFENILKDYLLLKE